MLTDREILLIREENRLAIAKHKKAKSRAQIQKEYRARLAEKGLIQISVLITASMNIAIESALESKQTGLGQFSKYQDELKSQIVNRALEAFFRKR